MQAEKTSTRTSDETAQFSSGGPSAAASTTAPTAPASKPKRGLFGRKRAPEPETYSEKLADQALDVSPENQAKKTEDLQPAAFSTMFRFSTKFELFMNFIGLIAAAAAGAAQPLMSLLFGNLTQDFVRFGTAIGNPDTPVEEVNAARESFKRGAASNAASLTYLGLAMFVATFIYMYIWVYTAEVNAKRIREEYLRAVLRQDIAYFDNVGSGEVATRIETDTHLVQQGISEKVALVVNFIAAFFTGFILAYVRNWRLALALSTIIPVIGITGATMNKFISRYMQLSLKHVAEGGSLAEEVISTVRTAQAFGTQNILSAMYDIHIGKAFAVDFKAAMVHGFGLSVFFFVIYSAYALAFQFGTTLIIQGHATAGEVVNVFFAVLIGSFSLAMLAPEMQAVTHGRGAAAKLFATIDRVPPIDSSNSEGQKPEKVVGEIVLEGITFNYPSRPTVPVVKNINLTFPAGKTCALVGASGSGKSTAIGLIERFYDPLAGRVLLDGVDLRDLNLKWLRSQVGLVGQEPTLFATTIKGNVMHGLISTQWENASEEEKFALVKEACVKANADGFISKLPLGYDTMVGERGFLLSGGQKQRIAIARAIVSDPRILLLDEATSALDTQSEGVVQDALDRAAAGRTTITIAHRLSTIRDADRIFVMGAGEVLEQGTHNELLANPDGAYAKLVQAQKLREQAQAEAAAEDADADEPIADVVDIQKAAAAEVPLGRTKSTRSLASELAEKKAAGIDAAKHAPDLSLFQLFSRMAIINRSGWKMYVYGGIAAILTGAVYPCFGIVFAKGINGFSQEDNHVKRHEGDRNGLYFFIIAIGSMFTIGIQNYYFAAAAANLTRSLRSLSFKAVLRQDIEYFDQEEHSTGGIVSSLSDDPQKVNGLAGVTLGAIVQAISTLVVGVVLGLIFAWRVGLVGLACAPLLVTTGYIRLQVVVLKDQKNKKEHEASAQIACEAAGAIRTVASLTREDDCARIYSQALEAPLKNSNRTALWSNILYAMSQALSFFVIALVFWYGSRQVADGQLTVFHFFIGLMSTTFGAIQAGNVFSFVPDISSAKGAGSSIMRLLDSRPEIDAESTEGQVPQDVRGQVRFEDIHFRYPTRPGVRVLRGLNLTIEPGTYVALVGASGCGKSTAIQLIERFYDPLAGHVFLDGQDVAKMNIQEYRKHIALVSQEPTLYAGTVKFNILLGATKPEAEVTQEEIEEACRKANILEFVQSLPDGFETQVGGKGGQLSGGQKQRIAIARALLRNPKVLLLDEATSALDSTSEKVVQAALDQAAKGRTTIAIAHRLSTIQNADCIYFIQDGAVLESGTHDQLIAHRGAYYEYVQLQTLSKV